MYISTIAANPSLDAYAQALDWRGFMRADGRVGARNHRVVLSTVALTDQLAAAIAQSDPESLCIIGAFSRGLQHCDDAMIGQFLKAVLCHPNVGAALVITHDGPSADQLAADFAANATNSATPGTAQIPVDFLAFMKCKGRADALETGSQKLANLARQQSVLAQTRVGVPMRAVAAALECGGSDVSSSICANPVIGDVCDLLLHNGGLAVVSETAEFIGAERVFYNRCADTQVAQKILDFITYRADLIEQDSGKDYRGTNPTKENLDGGLTTLIEKSMGAVCKTGTAPFASALSYGETPAGAGLHFMDTPFFSPTSLTGMMMAGCNLGMFAMGVFNPSGNPLCPTIKICGNPNTIADWQDDIDVDLSEYFLGEMSREAAQIAVLDRVNATFNGALTAAEIAGEGQFLLPRQKDSL